MSTLKKILVVDDDPVVGKSFDRVLSGKGYAVITARNGEEALSKLASESYDLVFTDIKMPGMSGLEVAERVKARQPWLPVVIITGYGTADNEARAAAAGVSGFLQKPLSPEMIAGTTEKALLEHAATDAPAATPTPAVAAPAVADEKGHGIGRTLKNVALFFAAPVVGLAYVLAFPFVGLGMVAWIGGKALTKYAVVRTTAEAIKRVGMVVAGPLVGLAFVLLLPWIGAAMLAWIGGRAILKRYGTE
ncbi:MAG: response regulator [Betaproteobacteria bacterium]|nr:MAG: response regulator [Betaproteobacteria bacterium]